jgi:predicted RNA-binding protein with EMAP domain
MDPVTTVQLVDSAISLLKVCRAVVRTVQELRRADESLLEISHELEAFKEFLEGLKRVLENQGTSHRISTEVLDNVLRESRFTMNNLAKRLNRIRNVQSITKRRMLFLNAQTDISQLRNRLRHHSLRLNNILTLVHT